MTLTNKFVIVVPVWNAKDLIVECLDSLFDQEFDDLGIIIRDDISTDKTDEVIKQYLGIDSDEVHMKFRDKDVIFVNNKFKRYPVGNTYDSVMHYVDNKEAVIGVVDGDDKLIDTLAVQKIFDIYEKQGKWMVWSQHVCADGSKGQSNPMPDDSVIYSGRHYWAVSHFRTSKAFLYHNLKSADLMDPFEENSYYTYAGDAAFLFPFCEMCGNENSFFLDEPLYQYNNVLPTNEHRKGFDKAVKYGMHIRQKGKKYSRLSL